MLIHNSALADETCALNAIYGEGLVVATFSDSHHTTLSVKFPGLNYSFLLRVLDDYPQSPPELLGVDDLVESTKAEVQQNAVYFGACVRAVHHPESVCLYDAVEEFEMIYRSTEAESQPGKDTDGVAEIKASKKAVILRDLAIRARAKSDATRPENLTRDSPFDVVDCSACLEPFFRIDTAVLRCRHSLCSECLHEGLLSMFKIRSELKCCGQSVPLKTIRQYGGLDADFLENFIVWLQELHTPNATYCPWKDCLAYIPRSFVQEDYTKCPLCKRRMCMGCKKKEHGGICKQDKKLIALIEKGKWKFCPACGQLVERSDGCNHMTCICGAEFCYRCGTLWRNGRSVCMCGLFRPLD